MSDKLKKKSSKEPEISAWKDRILRSKDFQKTYTKNWDRNEKLIFGHCEGVKQTNTVAYGWGLVQALATSIYVQNPDAMVEPYDKSKSFEQGAMWSAIMQYDIDMMDLKSIGNIGLLDNFCNGYFAAVECLDTYKTDRVVGEGKKAATYTTVEDQEYSARRIAPKDVLFDWQGNRIDLSDSRFLICAWYPTVADLMARRDEFTTLPDKETLMNLKTAYADDRFDKDSAQHGGGETRRTWNEEDDPDFKTVCVWEIYDKINKKEIYVLDECWQEIGSIDWAAKFKIGQRDMFPVTLMAFHPMQKGLYPKAEIDLIANQLMMLNLIDAVIYEDTLTKWRKFATLSGLITPDKLAKIVSTDPANSVIEIDRDQIMELARDLQAQGLPDISQLIMAIPDPQAKQDMMVVRDMIRAEINDIIGYGPPERGGMPSTRSAREAVAIKEKLDARLAKRADAVAEFYRLFGMKHFKLLQQTLEIKRYARVFSFVEGAEFKQYAREDIQGGFSYRVFAGTSGPQTTEAKRANELQLFQTLMPLIQGGMIPPEPCILRLAENFQWVGVGQLLKNYVPATQELAALLFAMKNSPQDVPPEAILEASAKVVQAVLSPQQIQAIQTTLAGQTASGKAQPAKPPKGERGDSNPLGTSSGAM